VRVSANAIARCGFGDAIARSGHWSLEALGMPCGRVSSWELVLGCDRTVYKSSRIQKWQKFSESDRRGILNQNRSQRLLRRDFSKEQYLPYGSRAKETRNAD
jgi:hypothetical protein